MKQKHIKQRRRKKDGIPRCDVNMRGIRRDIKEKFKAWSRVRGFTTAQAVEALMWYAVQNNPKLSRRIIHAVEAPPEPDDDPNF